MAYNKIIFKTGEIALDLTQDTVSPDTLLEGATAHDQNGELITGTAKEYVDPTLQEKTVTANGVVTADEGYDGLSAVTVNVPDTIPTLQNKTVSPTTSQQTIAASTGYDGLGTVTVNAVTASIDANIVASNIRKGVTILGVTGTYEGDAGYKLDVEIYNTDGSATFDFIVQFADGTTRSESVSNVDYYYTNPYKLTLENVSSITVTNVNHSFGALSMVWSTGQIYNGIETGVPIILTQDTEVSLSTWTCFLEGTQITLADGSTKACEDITYDDELLVWDFYEGKFSTAKPTWIKVKQVASQYNKVTFDNGTEIGFVGPADLGYHRIFNKEAGKFTYTGSPDTPNGTTTFTSDGGWTKVVNQEIIKEPVNFYNIITDKHYNLFANGILTSCRLSNKYAIEDMKYVGDLLISKEAEEEYFKRIESLKV